jgi:hypothetical protein
LIMEKRDQACIWAKHCDPSLKAAITELLPEQPIHLLVNGSRTIWAKMRDGRDGRPTPGIKIIDGQYAWGKIALHEECDISLRQDTDSVSESKTLLFPG